MWYQKQCGAQRELGDKYPCSDNEHSSQEAKRIRIVNNLLVGIVADTADNIPYFLKTNGGQQITVFTQHRGASRQHHHRLRRRQRETHVSRPISSNSTSTALFA
jgi:hypothetical protein